ncbi:MAG: hypothetical protein Q6363_009720 [Candidatus Njordarchaeota archaeon]
MPRKRKKIDIVQHFRRIIFRDMKSIAYMLNEQVNYIGTFSQSIPDMLGFAIISSVNKISLLSRLVGHERVDREIVGELKKIIDGIKIDIETSKVPYGLKAYGLSTVVLSKVLLDMHDEGIELLEKAVDFIDMIEDSIYRSIVLRDVLYTLGMIRRYTKREAYEIPEETINSMASIISDTVQKIINETEFIGDPYVRGRIFANVGFGTRLFSVISKAEIMAQWYDVNQSQRLALDALDEAEKVGDWYQKGILLADAAAVLAISGDDTVNLAGEKFDAATEIAFKNINNDPLRASQLLARIAYDKAFTKYYLDSDKYFYESIVIPIEAMGLAEAMPTIMRVLRLASKARYFYIIYEVIKDWLLPMIDAERGIYTRAKFLALCANAALPVSINWSVNIAREALAQIKGVIDSELVPLYYDMGFLDDSLPYVSNILDLIPIMANIAFILPRDSIRLLKKVFYTIDKLLMVYLKYFKRKYKGSISEELVDFSEKLGVIISALRDVPNIYASIEPLATKFISSLEKIIQIYNTEHIISSFLLYTSYAYGLAFRQPKKAGKYVELVIDRIFKFEKNMWLFKDKKMEKAVFEDKIFRDVFSSIMAMAIEIAFKANTSLKETMIKILIDISETTDQRKYTEFLTLLFEKIDKDEISKQILINVFNVLIDEGKITRKRIPRRFYRIINNIDPMLAKFISEEIP